MLNQRTHSEALAELPLPIPGGAGESLKRPVSKFVGGIIAVTTVTIWLMVIYNRFLTPHEGWFSYYGLLMKSGQVPYRDFYFFTQPVHLFLARAISEFGDKLIYFRYYGVFDRILITAVYYYVLSRQFSAAAAVCGTVASSFLFLAYPTDALFSYLYTCLLFLLVSVACLHKAWLGHRRLLWMFLAGVSAALCFFTKQSNGLLAIAGIGFTIFVIAGEYRRAARDLVSYAAGVIAGSVPFLVWLATSGAWTAYVNQVFLGAAASKGGLKAVLFGFIGRQVDTYSVAAFVGLSILAIVLASTGILSITNRPGAVKQLPPWVAIAAVCGTTLFGVLIVRNAFIKAMRIMPHLTMVEVNVVLYILMPVLLYVLWRRYVGDGERFIAGSEVPIALLIASVYWTYGCGMSWNVAEQSVIPSLGLLLAFCYDRVRLGQTRLMSAIVILAAIGYTQVGIWHKWNLTFNWEGWFESISPDKAHSHWPQISDFALAKNEVLVYDTLFDEIAKYTKPGEPIVSLFTIPMFNFIGSHWQPAFAPVEYWDVCPDAIAVKDAARVKAARPKMIVELELADWIWKEHDEGWRTPGRKSGQRQFQDAINELIASGDYRQLHSFPTPQYKMNLVLWLRYR